MKLLNTSLTVFFLAMLSTTGASAESDKPGGYHPFLTDTFTISLGVFRPKKKVTLGFSDGSTISEEIDATDTENTAALNFRWRYTENWSFWGQYWSTDSGTTSVLSNDIVIDTGNGPVTFLAGSSVNAGVESSVLRLFFGRSFFKKPQSEWGAGAGLHWMELDAFVSTNVATVPDIGDINGTRRKSIKGGVPLPNLGAWYMYSWSPKWITTVRLDWLDIDLGEYAGSLYNVSAGVNYQFSKNVGVGLAFNAFDLQAEARGNVFNGNIESRQWGPFLSLSANW